MSYVDILIGNTSSGIIEAASFAKPVINIGNRQKGRTRNLNVLDSDIKSLKSLIEIALSDDFENKIQQSSNEKLIKVRQTFDRYPLISALHSFMSVENKNYSYVLPPLTLLNPKLEEELLSKLKELDFTA